MISLPPIKNTVHDSIDLIERTYLQRCDEEALKSFGEVQDWAFKYEFARSVFRNQAHMVRLTAIERNISVVWLTRNHTALETLTNFLCYYAKTDAQQISEGYMRESDFPALCNACGVVAASKLRICDANSMDEFEEIALVLAKENEFSFILCDWDLSKDEVGIAENLAPKGNVAVCWPP